MPFTPPLFLRSAFTFVSILTMILAMLYSERGFSDDSSDQNTSDKFKRAQEEMKEAMKKQGIERESNTLEKVVDRCIQNVRKEQPGTRFDAYIQESSKVNSFGTEEETYKFKKCMAKSGFPLDSRK
jgi:hypothetical protein